MRRLIAVACALCGLVALAVDPVAVWNGDFSTLTKGDYTLNANSNTVAADGSTITISAAKGVTVSWPTGRGAETTIVKLSGLRANAQKVQTLFTAGDGTSARVGVTLNTDGTTKGIWDGSLWYNASYCQKQDELQIPDSGSMYVAIANAYNGGTRLYEKTENCTLVYQANGLQSSSDSTRFKTVSIGGSVASNANYGTAEGLVIEAIAVFDRQLTQDEIAAYSFPDSSLVSTEVSFTTFLSEQYQDTGWKMTLDQLKVGTTKITGTMDGNYVSGNNVAATGYYVRDAMDDTTPVVEFQMQIYQDGGTNDRYLKATRVFAKEQNGTIWLRAVESGNIQNGTLGTEVTNWNGTLAQNATAPGYGVASVTVTYLTAKLPPVEPLMLVNFGYTTAEQGWYNYTQNRGNTIPSSGTLTTNDVSFTATNTIGNFFNSTDGEFDEVTSDWEEGTYEDIFGNSFTTIADELRSSLGVADLPFSANVYKSALMNGGYAEHQVTISGLDGSSKYVVYTGFGMRRTNYPSQVMGVQFDSSGYASVEALDYITTVDGMATTKANRYQSFTAGTQLRPGSEGLLLTRLTNVQPKADGTITFTFKGDKGGINFLAVAKVNEVKPTSTTIDISGVKAYANLATDGFADVTLNLTGDAELTLDKAVTANLTFTGAHNLTVKGAQHLTFTTVNDAGVTGTVTYEIGGAYTAADGLKNKIKSASSKYTFVFTGNAMVDFTSAALGTINSHLVFCGDAPTLKITNGNNKFAASATYEKPTVLVERGTLTFYGHDVTGWAAGTDANGIVRVMNGATLQLENFGTGTFYYNQRIAIDAGATVCVGSSLNSNQFRMTEGVAGQQIWVQDCDTDMSKTPAKLILESGQLALAKDGSAQGIGVYVGKNAKLQISGTINSLDSNNGLNNSVARMVKKTGAGALEVSGTHGVTYEVAAGSIGGSATIKNLSMSFGTTVAVSKDAHLTVETQATLQNPQLIAGTLENELVVITVPSAYAVTSPTATDGVKTYELKRSGNELRLVYKVSPSRAEGSDLSVIPSVEGGVSDSVAITVPGLNEGDYAGEVTYTLHFGPDRAVVGVKEGDQIVFSFSDELKVGGQVLRGELTATFDSNKTLALGPVTVYQGERQFVWTPDGELWVNETPTTKGDTGTWTDGLAVQGDKLVVNAASGVTFTPTANPDYIETCDSSFTVSISASEAVDAEADSAPAADVQGGVRIASVGGVLKVQALVNGAWADLKSAGVDVEKNYAVVVTFHYAKDGVEGDADSVSYTLDDVTLTGRKVANTTAKISSVDVADGTRLAFLKGICQLDSAVVADVEIVIDHDETKEIDAEDLAAAQAKADKMVVAISDEVAKVVDSTTYRGYFKVVAKEGADGKFHAIVAFAPGVQEDIEDDIKAAMEKVVAGFETGSAAFTAKPGLYYGVKRGDALNDMAVRDPLTLAGADGKVSITITKPEKSNSHFYRIICSPTPFTADDE